MKKFIVLSHPRSGSSYLCAGLSGVCEGILCSHKQIACFDELFNTTPKTIEILKSLGMSPFPRQKDTICYRLRQSFKRQKDKKYQQFLQEFFSKVGTISNKKNIGFKLFAKQLPKHDILNLITNPDYKIILLRRQNMLQAAISYEIAKMTGQWNLIDAKDFAIKANITRLKHFIKDNKESIRIFRKHLHKNNKKFLEIHYEQLYTLDTVNKIFKFLGVKEYKNYEFQNSKLNNAQRYHMISNAEEIEHKLGSPTNGYLFR